MALSKLSCFSEPYFWVHDKTLGEESNSWQDLVGRPVLRPKQQMTPVGTPTQHPCSSLNLLLTSPTSSCLLPGQVAVILPSDKWGNQGLRTGLTP